MTVVKNESTQEHPPEIKNPTAAVKNESSQEHPPEIKTPIAAVKNESSQEHPPEIKTPIAAENKSQLLKKDCPIVGILILFILIIYSCVGPAKKSDHLSVWIRFPPQPDPVKVTVPAFSDYADVKKQVKDELSPSLLDTKSLGEILLLSVQYGKVDVTAGVLASAQKNQKKKQKPAKRTTWGGKSSPPPDWRAETIASASQPLVVFVDDIDTRTFLKQEASIAIRVATPLCFHDTPNASQKGYAAVAKVLLGSASFTDDDVRDLRIALCESSLDESWSAKPSRHW